MAERTLGRFFSGIIDFDSESAGLAGIQVNAKIWTHNAGLTARPILRTGPGSGGVPKVRMADIRGGGAFGGVFVPSQQPIPVGLKYAGGTIKAQLTDNCSISFAVRLSNLSFSHVEVGKGADENFHCSGQWVLAGAVTTIWNGTVVTITAPGANDALTYQGTTYTQDSRGLVTGAMQRVDVEGVTDSDVGKTAKLVAMIAAATTPPMPNLKIYSASYQQAEDDSTGGQVLLTWKLQDSKDDIETPRNNVTTDPNNLTDQKMLAQVYTTASTPPTPPSPPTGLKLRPPVLQKLNDQLSFLLWTWRRTDTADDVLNPVTKTETDPNDLDSRATRPVLWDPTGSPPSPITPITGLKLDVVEDTKLNDNVALRVNREAKTNSIDRFVLPRSTLLVDPSFNLTSSQATSAVDGAPPSLSAGFVDRGVETAYITTDHYGTIRKGGVRSTADDILNPLNKTDTDPNDLDTRATRAVLWDQTGSPPSPVTPISGLKLDSVEDTVIHAKATLRINREAKTNSIDRFVLPRANLLVDPFGLTSTQTTAAVDGAPPALNAGFVDRGVETISITSDHYGTVRKGGTRSTAQDIWQPHTRSTRSQVGPDTDDIAAIISSVASDASDADSLMAAVQGNDYMLGLSVTGIDAVHKLVIYEQVNPGVVTDFIGGGGERTVFAKIDSDGDVNVFVTTNFAETSGYRRVRFSPMRVNAILRSIVYRRFFKGTVVPDHASQFMNVNNATFDGLGTGKVIYESCSGVVKRSSAVRAFFINYHVRYDSMGLVAETPIDLFQGERHMPPGCTTSLGWVKASAVSSALAAAFTLPTASDLSFCYS